MPDVYVAVGGNVDPERYIARALDLLDAQFTPVRVSPAYRNHAVGFEGDDFINLVVGFAAEAPPQQVREALQAIEAACDRPPDAPKWAARTMDLDILLYGELVSDAPGLLLPRPDLVRRPYMLKPMVDLAPDLMHPTLKQTMTELWRELERADHTLTPVTIPRYDRRPPPGSAP